MTRLAIAGGIYLLLLALVIVFNHGAQALIFTQVFKAIPFRDGFSIAP